MIGLTIAWSISLFLALLFKCGTSFYAQWGSIQDLETKCRHVFAIEDGLVISDFLFDLLILLLPIPMVSGPLYSLQHGCRSLIHFRSGVFKCHGYGE